MNYYIQGNKEKADQIKAAFEAKGCVMHTGTQCDLSDMVYFSLNGKVGSLKLRNLDLFKTHPDYQELELPIEPCFKVGDKIEATIYGIKRRVTIRQVDKTNRCYFGTLEECIGFSEQDQWHLAPKPKFKVGDWLVYENGNCFAGGLREAQVVKVEDGVYFFASGTSGSFKFIDENCRLWTIQDAKDGDVLVTTSTRSCPFIYRNTGYNNDLAYYYAGVDGNGDFCEGCLKRTLYHFGPVANVAPATKEKRDLLFVKMKEAGYTWDADKKELRKIKPHYDIANFHAGMPVLVRADNGCSWDYSVFSRITGNEYWKFAVCNGVCFTQCIPFEGNEHLLGTTDMCDEMYINW